MNKITPFLWFESQAEEAMNYYISIFKNSKVLSSNPQSVNFILDGQEFIGLNAGPQFKFNEAISFQIYCETQDEVNFYWEKLSEGGDPNAQQCGWLKDKYGVSWQVIPTILIKMLKDQDSNKSQKVMKTMLQMKKIDMQSLSHAYEQA